jgi:hypothetical protein
MLPWESADQGLGSVGQAEPGRVRERITDVDGNRIIACATNTRRGQLADLELRHRRRARCEDRIRLAKDTGLNNLPLHDFNQNRMIRASAHEREVLHRTAPELRRLAAGFQLRSDDHRCLKKRVRESGSLQMPYEGYELRRGVRVASQQLHPKDKAAEQQKCARRPLSLRGIWCRTGAKLEDPFSGLQIVQVFAPVLR